MVRTGERPLIWTLDERKRMVARQMLKLRAIGRREAFTLRLASGRQVAVIESNAMLTFDGWTELRELKVGDRLAVARRVPEALHPGSMTDDEVVLLGHMIGDGSCVKRQPIRYASIDDQNLRAVSQAARHFGVTAVRDEYAAARVTTLRLPAPYRLTHGRRNPIAAWLDRLGLFGLRSYEKFVPAEVFALRNDQVALFLGHLWATDGCVAWDGKQRRGRIYYGSSSRRLVDDVMQLMLRFGFASRIYRAPKAGYRDMWHLDVSGAVNQVRFLRSINVNGEKFFAANEVLENLAGVRSNGNVDTVPPAVWGQVRKALSEQGLTHRAFAQAMDTKFCGSTMWKHSPSRGRLHRVAAVLDDQELHDLATNDVFWDRLVEIVSVGEQDAYGATLSGTQNFVAHGVCVHGGH